MTDKIAIACQGGGSQTAFTAGVLKAFFENRLHQKKRLVSLSGTSGGAVCATLAWYGLLKAARGDGTPIQQRLLTFWEEVTAQSSLEELVDASLTGMLRLVDGGLLPTYQVSPGSAAGKFFSSFLPACLPRKSFTDFACVLKKHIAFDELPNLVGPESPVLLLGAADVLTGELKKFNSRKGEIQLEAILASAAVPNLFSAVEVGGHYYWDGLFSDNPPVKELILSAHVGGDHVPDELWIIQINPTRSPTVPTTSEQIIDRRNEMLGNVSLLQSLEYVQLVNALLAEKGLSEDFLRKRGVALQRPITIRTIQMSEELQKSLDHISKFSRARAHIQRLVQDGQKRGLEFLQGLSLADHSPSLTPPVEVGNQQGHPLGDPACAL